MMHKMMALAVVLLLGADAAKDDSSKLQGTWQAVSSNKGGQDDPNADQHSMTFEKDTVVIKRGDRVILKGTFKLDAAKSPKHIDIDIEEGPEKLKGKTGHGIYELKDDTLKWAVAEPGETDRPTGFGSTEGTKNMVVNLKKK